MNSKHSNGIIRRWTTEMNESIVITDLCKDYRDVRALDRVSLTVHEGELFGLLGVNGAGKTTLIKILSGLVSKTAGEASVAGLSVPRDLEKIKEIIAVSPQETAIAPNLTVMENLRFFAAVYGKKDEERLQRIVRTFHLETVLGRRAKTLSGGWGRRLSVALALVSEPQVLFLDEPTLGLDVLARRELWEIIRALKGKITVVLTSHYLEEIEALCDRVAILSSGHLLETGSVAEIKARTGKDAFEDAFVAVVEGGVSAS